MKIRQIVCIIFSLVVFEPVYAAMAENGGISLNQTRVVFLATDKAQTVTVKNSDNKPYLLQARIQMTPTDTTQAPFVITPPLFQLKGQSIQLLRIVPTTATLPIDRESLFYLSLLAIPAQESKTEDATQLSMGMRFVIKLFYRPEKLIERTIGNCALQFSRIAQGVRIENQTPYYQTFGALDFNDKSINLDQQPSMLAPFSEQIYSVSEPVQQAKWRIIADHGGLAEQCIQPIATTAETK